MLFSTATAYALQALTVLPEDGSYRLAKDLAEQLDLPGPYLAKILQSLAQAGILESQRGPKGGFRLACDTFQLTVGQVMQALEGPGSWDGCLLGHPICDHRRPCPLHKAWVSLRKDLGTTLAQTTIRDLQRHRGRAAALAPRRAPKAAVPARKAAAPARKAAVPAPKAAAPARKAAAPARKAAVPARKAAVPARKTAASARAAARGRNTQGR